MIHCITITTQKAFFEIVTDETIDHQLRKRSQLFKAFLTKRFKIDSALLNEACEDDIPVVVVEESL